MEERLHRQEMPKYNKGNKNLQSGGSEIEYMVWQETTQDNNGMAVKSPFAVFAHAVVDKSGG